METKGIEDRCILEHCISTFSMYYNDEESLLEHRLLGSVPEDSDSGSEVRPRICISNRLPGNIGF